MSEYKKYHKITRNSVKVVELRETKNYLVDVDGVKYKKDANNRSGYVATNIYNDIWFGSSYIYPLNHPSVIQKVQYIREQNFCKGMSDELRLLAKECDEKGEDENFEFCKEICLKLGFDLKIPTLEGVH